MLKPGNVSCYIKSACDSRNFKRIRQKANTTKKFTVLGCSSASRVSLKLQHQERMTISGSINVQNSRSTKFSLMFYERKYKTFLSENHEKQRLL